MALVQSKENANDEATKRLVKLERAFGVHVNSRYKDGKWELGFFRIPVYFIGWATGTSRPADFCIIMRKMPHKTLRPFSLHLAIILFALSGCQQAFQKSGGMGANDAPSVITRGTSDEAGTDTSSVNAPVITDGLQASYAPGGVVNAPPSNENINPCALDPEKCADRGPNGTIQEECPKEAVRKVCWKEDFQKGSRLSLVTTTNEYEAISLGRIPPEAIAQANFRDYCVEGWSGPTPSFFSDSSDRFCVFVRPDAEALFLTQVHFETQEDFASAFEGAQFLAFYTAKSKYYAPSEYDSSLTEDAKEDLLNRLPPKPIK